MDEKIKKLVKQYLQEDGTLLLPQSNNWWLRVDLENPDAFECYTTKEDGTKKIHSARIHPGPPYPQLVFDENDVVEDNTVGAIGLLVWIGPNGVKVAGRENQRHGGKVWEAWRKSYSSDFKAPAQAEHGSTTQNLVDRHLGRGLSNSARLVTPKGLAMIAYGCEILVSTDEPELTNQGEWKDGEWFMICSLDQMGKAVFGVLNYMGYLPKPNSEKLESYKEELRSNVQEWSK